MLKLPEQARDEIVRAIQNSVIPTNVGIQIISVLQGLEKVVEKSEK